MMDAKALQYAITQLAWDMNFDTFCQEILQHDPDTQDAWLNEKWRAFKALSSAIRAFDADTLQRLLDTGEERQP